MIVASVTVLPADAIEGVDRGLADKMIANTLLEMSGGVDEEGRSCFVVLMDDGKMVSPLRLVQFKASGFRIFHYEPGEEEYEGIAARVLSGEIVQGEKLEAPSSEAPDRGEMH